MNPNKRKVLLNIINSKKENVILPEVVEKVETKIQQSEIKEEVQLGLKDLEVQESISEAEFVQVESLKSKKNKKLVDNE